jgi:integrase
MVRGSLSESIEEPGRQSIPYLAVELTLLIFIRSSELSFARWSEIDFDTAMWTIPAEREAIEGVKHFNVAIQIDGFDPPSQDVFRGRIGKETMLKLLTMNVSKSL